MALDTTTDAAMRHEVPSAEPELEAGLQRLLALITEAPVNEARAYIHELEARWPDDARVRHYARVLAPPVTRVLPGVRGRPLDRDYAWIREHAREHPGCWLAVYEDRLIAADPDLGRVIEATREREPEVRDALLHFEPKVLK